MLLPLALVACGDRERSADGTDVPPVASEDADVGTLPTPAASPGTSVTGMPTSPPPAAASSVEPAPTTEPAPVATAPTDESGTLPAPVDPTTAPVAPQGADGTTPPAVALPAADASAATSVMTQYMAAVSAGAFARAQGLWATTPNDSAVLELARGASFEVSVGAATGDSAGRAVVPVDVRGKADDGSDRHIQATYTLQRAPGGPWRIQTASTHDATP